MNILFLADPNSIHDIKWISYFSTEFTCYLIARKEHLNDWKAEEYDKFYGKYRVEIIGSLHDFSIRFFPRTLREHKKLRRLFTKYNIDIFHAMYADPNCLWAVFRNMRSKEKWILTTRGTDILKGIPNHFGRKDLLNRSISFLYTKAFRNFDQITCTSQMQKEGVKKITGQDNGVAIIRTGVDVANVLKSTVQFQNPLLSNKNYVLFPRNMRPIYNHEFSLEAIRLLPASVKEAYFFVFVDKNSPEQEYVHKIDNLMQQDRAAHFVFMNKQSQEEIWQLYKEASLVVMNPLSDGTPVTAMEAMLCQSPLIVGNVNYDKELFENAVIKLSSWDPRELASAMTDVLTEKIGLNKAAAYSRILEMGNREIEMKKLRSIYLS